MTGVLGVARAVARMLTDGGMEDVYVQRPSALRCEEPIVVLADGFEREVLTADMERGTVGVLVLVVRELAEEAGSVALDAEYLMRRAGWEPYADCGAFRICGIDTTVPTVRDIDGSGRSVWEFTATVTVVRAL